MDVCNWFSAVQATFSAFLLGAQEIPGSAPRTRLFKGEDFLIILGWLTDLVGCKIYWQLGNEMLISGLIIMDSLMAI
jgi:hypothetical protein